MSKSTDELLDSAIQSAFNQGYRTAIVHIVRLLNGHMPAEALAFTLLLQVNELKPPRHDATILPSGDSNGK